MLGLKRELRRRPGLALSMHLARQAFYTQVLNPLLQAGETVLDAGTCVWVEYAQSYGRGRGEGVLGFTEEHLYFEGTSDAIKLAVPLRDIEGARLLRSIIPGTAQLRFFTSQLRQVTLFASKDFLNDSLARISRG